MKKQLAVLFSFSLLLLSVTTTVWADEFSDTVKIFKDAPASSALFNNCHGYALFPTIGKGGIGIGAAHGDGRVHEQGER